MIIAGTTTVQPDTLHLIGRHRANRLPDANSRATCTYPAYGIEGGWCIYECPRHDPHAYAETTAAHRRCMNPFHFAKRHPLDATCSGRSAR